MRVCKVHDRSKSERGGMEMEGTCERGAEMEVGVEESGGFGRWVQIKPSSGGLTCLECVSELAWLRDRHSALGGSGSSQQHPDVLSVILHSHMQKHTHRNIE